MKDPYQPPTLRDQFAMHVAGNLSRAVDFTTMDGRRELWPPARVAMRAYAIADAMLAARTRSEGKQ